MLALYLHILIQVSFYTFPGDNDLPDLFFHQKDNLLPRKAHTYSYKKSLLLQVNLSFFLTLWSITFTLVEDNEHSSAISFTERQKKYLFIKIFLSILFLVSKNESIDSSQKFKIQRSPWKYHIEEYICPIHSKDQLYYSSFLRFFSYIKIWICFALFFQ